MPYIIQAAFLHWLLLSCCHRFKSLVLSKAVQSSPFILLLTCCSPFHSSPSFILYLCAFLHAVPYAWGFLPPGTCCYTEGQSTVSSFWPYNQLILFQIPRQNSLLPRTPQTLCPDFQPANKFSDRTFLWASQCVLPLT